MILAENSVVAGRFRLNRLLGRGGMGSIWHATHLGLDIPCALKFIEGHLADMADMNARFEREAKAAARLRSPHVVQILDHGIWEGVPYIAMELLEGEDLGKRLERVRKLSSADVVAVIDQVTRALGKAHGLGIVHRDLKPDNIFLVRDDDREIAKVLDFGIAKTNVELVSGATKTGAMLGTPYYMSPEQAQGTKSLDLRSDLWSLAVIVFECVTGVRPFESEALGDLLMRIMVAPLPVPSQVAQVPPGFDAWWTKAAMRDPAQRYQSAKELAEALALALGVTVVPHTVERPLLATAPLTTPLPRPATPAPAPQTMSEAVLPLLHPKLAATTGAAVVGRTQDGTEAAPLPARQSRGLAIGAAVIGLGAAAGIAFALWSRTPSNAHAASPSVTATTATTADPPAQPPPPPAATQPTETAAAHAPPSAEAPAEPAATKSAAVTPAKGRDAGALGSSHRGKPEATPGVPPPAAPPSKPAPAGLGF
jgi:serine/threonine protein kinase